MVNAISDVYIHLHPKIKVFQLIMHNEFMEKERVISL